MKEFWHVGRDLPPGHVLEAQQPPNAWPSEVPHFRDTFTQLYDAFDAVGARMLRGIARYLDLAPDWFDDTVKDGNSVMRLLHYPPVTGDAPGMRAEAHEDINTITLLLGAEEAGLEILDKDGSWLPVAPPPGALAVNVGDMLQRLTNHRLPSTTHRVRNPDAGRASVARYSMPFFLHFRSDFLIETLPGCVDDAHPNRYPTPILADDYLQQRLREIGLKEGMALLWFMAAAVFEIAGCFAFWAWVRDGKSGWWLVPGIAALIAFVFLLTRVDTAFAGRAYAAYGGVYIAASLFWLWAMEGQRPSLWDWAGSALCLAGMLVIILGNRAAGG